MMMVEEPIVPDPNAERFKPSRSKSHWIIAWWAAIICLAGVGLWATIAIHPVPERTITGLVANPVTPTTYKPVHYLFFNGNASWGYIPAKQNLNVRQFSISFWAKSDEPNHGSFDRPIETLQWIRNSAGVFILHGWAFDAGNQIKIGIDKLRFTVANTHSNLFGTNAVTVPRNSWTNIVGTFDGTTLNLYQNGALVDAFPFSGPYSYSLTPLPIRFAFGFGQPTHYWTGDLSDIRIYGRSLSSPEINSIFHVRDISDGLIGNWKLNEGSGSSIIDSSGRGNNGIVHNPTWR
jgi:hypothetical protein